MNVTELLSTLQAAVPAAACEAAPATDQPTVYVPREHVTAVMTALRDDPALAFAFCAEVTAADYLPRDPRFEVVYMLVSFVHRQRLRVKVRTGGESPSVPTVSTIWPSAGWPEREVYDLFGIVFDGHADLRRLLTPDDWNGFPLRKDFPVQVRRTTRSTEPLQVTAEEFRANMEADRTVRRKGGQ